MSDIKKPTRNVSGVGAITPLYQSDIDRKIDDVVAVTYNENDEGERINFAYTVKSPEDIERPETETE